MEARSSGSISLGSIHKTCGPGRPQLHLGNACGTGFEGMKDITLRGLRRTVPYGRFGVPEEKPGEATGKSDTSITVETPRY